MVSLKVDYRTHSHAQGLFAIVYEMKESTGGILVCCQHGVITHDGSRKDYWVPYDKYTVNSRAQDTCPIGYGASQCGAPSNAVNLILRLFWGTCLHTTSDENQTRPEDLDLDLDFIISLPLGLSAFLAERDVSLLHQKNSLDF